MGRRFGKEIIARDIEKFLRKKGLISKKSEVVIPEGGYDYEPDEYEVVWSGNFEVFRDAYNIEGYGSFEAFVPRPYSGEYRLYVRYKGKSFDVYE